MNKKDNKNKVNLTNIKNVLDKYKVYIMCIIIIILSIISICVQAIDKKNAIKINGNEVKGKNNKIAVYITGAVKNPGVYYLNENSRLNELLDICGGITQNADIEQINLAKKLVDSDKINIPEKQEKIDVEENINADIEINELDNKKININEASKESLMKLDGIGQTTADSIIEYRKVQRFLEIEDIMNVPGIGKSKYEKIKENIVVD